MFRTEKRSNVLPEDNAEKQIISADAFVNLVEAFMRRFN